jgi:outer membrane scaffolding protein for murein synthesis (MipA/OmpV family)
MTADSNAKAWLAYSAHMKPTRAVVLGLSLSACVLARAQAPAPAEPAQPAAPVATDPAAGPPPADTPEKPPAPPPAKWEGAIGLIWNHEPSYAGSGEMVNKLVPAFFLRYGRFTVTNASVFVTRRNDDVLRGASADLIQREDLRMNLALRVDNGRRESASDRLAGLGEVKRTIRGRLSITWRPEKDWRVSAGWAPDLLGHGGGLLFDANVARDFRTAPHGMVTVGVGFGYASDSWMQSYYGVTPEQSARSGYPVYTPRSGLTGVGMNLGWRGDINERWTAFVTGSASRMLGPALDSPLVTGRNNWSVNSGVAWRF